MNKVKDMLFRFRANFRARE